jgi:hypothetical protein
MDWRWIVDLLITFRGPPAAWPASATLVGPEAHAETLVALDWAEEITLVAPFTVGEGERVVVRASRLRQQLQARPGPRFSRAADTPRASGAECRTGAGADRGGRPQATTAGRPRPVRPSRR